ncbi:MAG: hypothetical protein MI725_16580 [Pirellulales bacterium]|nr:hypothetical protein [Pirellulales bacterium]
MLLVSGCQQQTTSKLLGQWIGRPDTVEARAAREAEKYGDARTEDQASSLLDKEAPKTDWENYDVAVAWTFVSSDRLEMSLANGSQALAGSWKIIGTSPTGCTIEVATKKKVSAESSEPVRRRFEVELDEREGKCVGFLLYETGADRRLGAFYFRRP